MKMSMRQIFLSARLLIRLCWPTAVFIGLCTGIFIAFIVYLQLLQNITRDGRVLGGSWLALFIFYCIAGVALIRFNAHLLHRSFGPEEVRVQRRMAFLSGLPFYALCLLCLMVSIIGMFLPVGDMCAAMLIISIPGILLFGLASGCHLLLTRFFLGRSTVIASQ